MKGGTYASRIKYHSVQIITIKGVGKNTQLLRSIQIKNMEHETLRRYISILEYM